MNQFSLYVIIALLLLNGVTGIQYFRTDKELTETKALLETCQKANQTNTTTIDIKDTVQDANDESCQSKIDAIKEAEDKAKEKATNLQNLYDEAKKKADALNAKNNALTNENKHLKDTIPKPEEMSDDEALEVVNYLDTLVPERIEREQLYRVRNHNKN